MGATASRITSLTTIYSTVHSGADKKKTSKLRVTDLCARNSPVTSEFTAQMASDAEIFPFDDVIMIQPREQHGVFNLNVLPMYWMKKLSRVVEAGQMFAYDCVYYIKTQLL